MNYTSREYWNSIMNASLCKFLILRVIYEEPMHGYEIIRHVAELTSGLCSPTEGAVYPILSEFERSGCVRSRVEAHGRRMRRVYALTPKGRKAYIAGLDVWQHGLTRIKQAIKICLK